MTPTTTYSLAYDPQQPRRAHNFCTGWRFCRGEVEDAQQPAFDNADWEPVILPHSFNAEDTFLPKRGYYRGPAWYRKRFRVDGVDANRRARLVFEGSFAVTTVWINGMQVASSVDGFTGTAVDITDGLVHGDNVLAMRVDNTHDPDVLPGREIPDYNLYGGIYREVWLVGTGDAHIPRNGLCITTPQASAESASVVATVRVRACRPGRITARALISDPRGRPVAEAEMTTAASAGETAVRIAFPPILNPRLWSPDDPNLYHIGVDILADGEPSDRTESRFGLRWFEFDPDHGFFINGRHLKLVGVNRHQDWPGLGNAVPPRLQRADARIIKELGGNFVRLSHYPQHPAFLDACDELGICVYAEIASWQAIGGPIFADNAEAMLRAMIRRDANHPSVVLWGLLNEGRDRALFERLNAAAHEEDSTRPTIYADNKPEIGIELGTVWVPDVLGINYKLAQLDELRAVLADRKLLCSEHTNAEAPSPSDLAQAAAQSTRINNDLDLLGARPWIAASALWSMHNYGTDYEPVWPCQRSGVIDEYRRPKEAFHLLRARWRSEPVVHIEGHWNPLPGVPTRVVRVYTNCEQVTLRLNGRDLGERSEGFIRTWEVPFEPGRLEAVGVKDGIEAGHEILTHGAPARLLLTASAQRLEGPGDACWLEATLLDAEGALVLTGQHEVEFIASGPVRIRGIGGRPVAATLRGIARIAVARIEGEGESVVRAAAGALHSAPILIAGAA